MVLLIAINLHFKVHRSQIVTKYYLFGNIITSQMKRYLNKQIDSSKTVAVNITAHAVNNTAYVVNNAVNTRSSCSSHCIADLNSW